jgi:hypothetical protein
MSEHERLLQHRRLLDIAAAGLESRGLGVSNVYIHEIEAYNFSNPSERYGFVLHDGMRKLDDTKNLMASINRDENLPAGLILLWDGQEIGGVPVESSRDA